MSSDTTAPLDLTSPLAAAEYPALVPGYLNTATVGIPPARAVAALRDALGPWAAGHTGSDTFEAAVTAARAAFARLAHVPADRVALAGSVAGSVGLIATALPPGAEVVAYERDFSALVHPFAARPDITLRLVPLEELAGAVRPGTALVAVSSAQSSDGRVADLPAIRAAAAAYGARTLVDATQSAGWLPLDASLDDYVVCHTYKWLCAPHGAAFLTVRPGAEDTLAPTFAGWYAAADRNAIYGPITELAPGAHRFDTRPAYLPHIAAAASFSLVEELGIDRVHAHDTALAQRLRDGFTALGYSPVPGPSAIVAVPGVPAAVTERLRAAGAVFAARAGNVRLAPHFYNTAADVDLVLAAAG
ncbi:aminotransferase class V-fold PLP-dependent enzyme [Streptomyces sp. NPDC021224]|uniref:aminotransferase class V-fold PLP-dependent enzyme n=1 Tax=unclassified Streptomyces TaxID=2593676 RepID=UPI003796FD11